MSKRLDDIKEFFIGSYHESGVLGDGHSEIGLATEGEVAEDIKWLIEQAEKLEAIRLISNAENVSMAEFAMGALKIIEGREVPTRKERS